MFLLLHLPGIDMQKSSESLIVQAVIKSSCYSTQGHFYGRTYDLSMHLKFEMLLKASGSTKGEQDSQVVCLKNILFE